jgi:hypothetical protein
MVEQRRRVEKHLEQEHTSGRGTEGSNHRQLDPHRQQDLDRVEADAGGDVELEIGVVHAVQAPQDRYGMKRRMLKIDGEIEQEHSEQNRKPARNGQGLQQPPSSAFGQCRKTDRGDGKDQPH